MLQENVVTSINKVFATTFKVLKSMLPKIKTPTINLNVEAKDRARESVNNTHREKLQD